MASASNYGVVAAYHPVAKAVPTPPYDEATVSRLMLTLSPRGGLVPLDGFVEAWIGKGAKDKERRFSALMHFLHNGVLTDEPESNSLALVDRDAFAALESAEGEEAGDAYAALPPRVVGRMMLSPLRASGEFFWVNTVDHALEIDRTGHVLLLKPLRRGPQATGAVSPTSGDAASVTVQYVGYFLTHREDVKDRDSETGRVEFGKSKTTLEMKGVIAGWRHLLPLLCVGDVVEAAMDASLAYGARGSHPIPSWASLVFKIGLVAVAPGSETKTQTEADALMKKRMGVTRDEFFSNVS